MVRFQLLCSLFLSEKSYSQFLSRDLLQAPVEAFVVYRFRPTYFFKSRLSNSHISFYWIAVGEKKSLLLIASIIVYIDISWKCDIWSLIKYFSPTSHSAAQGPWPQYGSLWTGNKWGTLNLVSMWIDILTLNKYAHISVSGFFSSVFNDSILTIKLPCQCWFLLFFLVCPTFWPQFFCKW